MSDSIGTIALVVSLVALCVALLQVLQQYTATADGFRRCHSSVMGNWAALTQRRFRLSELRFETVFAVPVIFLRDDDSVPLVWFRNRPVIDIEGTDASVRSTSMSDAVARHKPHRLSGSLGFSARKFPKLFNDNKCDAVLIDNDLVSWVRLLDKLQAVEFQLGQISSGFKPILRPAIQVSYRSWDFVPPDVMKPYAVSTLGDIAILVQRLGMSWKDFNPGEGVLRAEGNHSQVTSTMVRSLGILLSFSTENYHIDYHESRKNIFVPSWKASMLGFGLMPRDDAFDISGDFGRHPLQAFPVGQAATFDYHLRLYCGMGGSRSATSKDWSPRDFSVASEFIALVSPVLRIRRTRMTRLLRPAPNIGKDVYSSQSCMAFFRKKLYGSGLQSGNFRHLEAICKRCDEIVEHPKWDVEWNAPGGLDYNGADLGLLDCIHDACDWASYELREANVEDRPFDLLLQSHIFALFVLKEEELDSHWSTDPIFLMEFYFEKALPNVVRRLVALTVGYTREVITGLWLLLVFRGLCWYNLHHFKFKFAPVDEQYFGSNQQIYIG
ncbi:hypothetical protein PV08_03506 [Exophiala spinifera]|uniref:Uncharacterized protein n=1 Tax=Exophiala spinifera TaxID=91928 RepID=A0A0D2A2N9_9EURO|nr:uncharacterized protein PV08_03506 [Exophiala spinifera]KIW19212.1 hypothetical protein PV08_03506 [Exophiala spinifera]